MKWIVGISAAFLLGCGGADKTAEQASDKSSKSTVAVNPAKTSTDVAPSQPSDLGKQSETKKELSTASKSDAEVTLQFVEVKDLVAAIEANKGKVVVVDVWATFCPPCVQEFPHFIEFGNKFKDKNVVCISVTVDDKKSKAAALKFLKKQQSQIANFQVDYTSLQNVWNFSGVPICRIYGKSGEMAKQFNNDDIDKDPFTYKDVEKTVQGLLAK